MTTLIDTPEENEDYEKLKNKKNVFTENENSLLLNISKKYHEWLYFFRKNAVTLP